MVLIRPRADGSLGPLTAGGVTGVAADDAGAAGGVTNVAHQIGGSLGLAVLVAVFAAADGAGRLQGSALLAHRMGAALTAGAVLLILALLVALAVRPRRAAAPGQVRTEGAGAVRTRATTPARSTT
jgi:hypothetical protein